MTAIDHLWLAVLLAGFVLGVGMVLWGLSGDDDEGGGWGGPDDDGPEPEPLPGPSGRELVGAGR